MGAMFRILQQPSGEGAREFEGSISEGGRDREYCVFECQCDAPGGVWPGPGHRSEHDGQGGRGLRGVRTLPPECTFEGKKLTELQAEGEESRRRSSDDEFWGS